MNTLCPYTLRSLVDLPRVSDEHIIPRALGGSDQFVLRADQEANSQFGEGIDSRLIHADLVQFTAARLGLKGRRKPGKPATVMTFKTTGVEQESGQKVKMTFSQNGVSLGYVKPVEVDPVNGEIVAVRAIGDETETMLADMQKRLAGRGKMLVPGETRSIERPTKLRHPRKSRLHSTTCCAPCKLAGHSGGDRTL